ARSSPACWRGWRTTRRATPAPPPPAPTTPSPSTPRRRPSPSTTPPATPTPPAPPPSTSPRSSARPWPPSPPATSPPPAPPGPGTTHDVAAPGSPARGTVIATLAAGVAHDAAGNASAASTSSDNTVTFNSGPVKVTGTAAGDVIVLTHTAGGGPNDLTYVLNGGAPVPLTNVTSFSFDGLGGNDVMIVDFVNGSPVVAGGIFYDGGATTNIAPANTMKVVGTGTQPATYDPTAGTYGTGVYHFLGGGDINFSNVAGLDVTGMLGFTLATPQATNLVTLDTAN